MLRTGQRFGAAHVIDVLRGKTTDKVTQWGHASLSTFGIGTDDSETAWKSVFRQLVAQGLLTVDHDSFGALKVTEASRAILKGEQAVSFRRAIERKTPRERSAYADRSGPGASTSPVQLNPDARELWERLRAWRAVVAKQSGVPAYVVFHDATLAEIARLHPRSEHELRCITGIGERKLERYGSDVLELLRE